MTFTKTLNSKLAAAADYLHRNKKRALFAGSVLYIFIFALFSAVTIIPIIRDTRTLLGCDGAAQFYPYLLDFRRNLLSFFESIKNGSPEITMINFDYYFGTDVLVSTGLNFIAFFPFYALSVFVPEAGIPLFFAVGVVLLSFLSGFSFMYLCSYYRRNPLWSGLMAPFYVFCGNYFFTAVANPQFLYMFIAFPLMIVGIDKIIKDKSPVLFVLSVFWLSLCGFVFVVYTLPFVVVFAVIRVYFLHKNRFFASLGRYFLRGSLCAVLGMAMAGFIFLPFLKEYLSSVRAGGSEIDIASLLIPSVEELARSFDGVRYNFPTGISAALIPCFLYFFTSGKTRKEVRCCCFVMLGLIALPLIRYGLNGFQYALCRWGFIPALLICFCCTEYLPKLIRMSRADRRTFIFTLLVYTGALILRKKEFAVVFMIIIAAVNGIPFFKKQLSRLVLLPGRLFFFIKKSYKEKGGLLPLVLAGTGTLAIIMLVAVIIASRQYTLTAPLLIPAFAALVLSFTKKNKALSSLVIALVCITAGVMNISGKLTGFFRIEASPALEAAAEIQPSSDTFGRVSQIIKDVEIYQNAESGEAEPESTEAADNADETQTQADLYSSDPYLNLAPRYTIPSAEFFRSTVSADIMNFFKRCGQDFVSVSSSGDAQGFSGKEVLYSLFGVETLFTFRQEADFYGFEEKSYTEFSDGSALRLYKNNLSLPAGTAYKNIIDKTVFDSFNSAELPYAMLDSVYLEGYEAESNTEPVSYSRSCAFTLAQELRGETVHGIKCYNNTVTVSDDLSGCFVYLCFDGVKSRTYADALSEVFTITVDNKTNCVFGVHNSSSNWEWKYTAESYTFALGYQEENINEIFFISPFEFESVSLYAVSEEAYTPTCEKRRAEKLENVEIGTNTLAGSITLAEDSALVINLLYSEGWTAFADGEEVPLYKANGLFLGIPLSAGSHEVQIKYRTPWLTEGVILSAAAWAVFAAIAVFVKKKNI